MLFEEIIAVYTESHKKPINKKNAALLFVKVDGNIFTT
jgi:hypothetical protein